MMATENPTKPKRVRAMSVAELKKQKIKKTAANRAIIEVMLEISDTNLEVLISEAELTLLTEVYERHRRVKTFKDLHALIDADAGVACFWLNVSQAIRTENEKDRHQAWRDAYASFERYVLEGHADLTPWTQDLLAFVRRELLMLHGFRIIAQTKPSRYIWRN